MDLACRSFACGMGSKMQREEQQEEREGEIGNGDLRSSRKGRKVNVCQSSLQFFVRWSVAWLAFGLVKAYWIPDPKPSPDYETYVQMLPWHVIIQDFSARSIFFPFVASYFLWLLAFAQSPAGGFRPANHQPSIKAMQPCSLLSTGKPGTASSGAT